ncbi:unknown [[Mannheimia] succiniciproducens MBEL55E]|uniref:Uncharacterized protein n=1 Tax=Mannheimia succiniciproducens (strain KCTC 0769BP / MBEL55E) TaxID=221988 RepID=Q65SW0_MANSM|nr:unknown [[Mannheimia] succiniciproducens MBEL55E]
MILDMINSYVFSLFIQLYNEQKNKSYIKISLSIKIPKKVQSNGIKYDG